MLIVRRVGVDERFVEQLECNLLCDCAGNDNFCFEN